MVAARVASRTHTRRYRNSNGSIVRATQSAQQVCWCSGLVQVGSMLMVCWFVAPHGCQYNERRVQKDSPYGNTRRSFPELFAAQHSAQQCGIYLGQINQNAQRLHHHQRSQSWRCEMMLHIDAHDTYSSIRIFQIEIVFVSQSVFDVRKTMLSATSVSCVRSIVCAFVFFRCVHRRITDGVDV